MGLTVSAGECYLLGCGNSPKHYFFVISEPTKYPDRPLVVVPISSVSPDKTIDLSCILSSGEHQCCTKESFASYSRAILISIAALEQMINRKTATPKPPLASIVLLNKLRAGAEISEDLRDKIHDELYMQGILPPL